MENPIKIDKFSMARFVILSKVQKKYEEISYSGFYDDKIFFESWINKVHSCPKIFLHNYILCYEIRQYN